MNTRKQSDLGLSDRDLSTITEILSRYQSVHKVMVFGSRSQGNFHAGSDIDLAIIEGNPTILDLAKLKDDFYESTLPYFVDVLILADIKDQALKNSILQGRVLYDLAS